MVDWTDVAKVVAPMAPTIGGLLGGLIPFPGGALAGQALGNIIAKQFGVPPTPEAVKNAIQNNPNEVVLAKLQAAAEEAKAQWPALAEMAKAEFKAVETSAIQVNQTMRVENENRHWFFTGWRPFAGWLFNFFATVFGLILAWAVLMKDGPMLVAIKDVQIMAASLLGALAAIVGVYVIGRSHEKAKLTEAATATTPPSVIVNKKK